MDKNDYRISIFAGQNEDLDFAEESNQHASAPVFVRTAATTTGRENRGDLLWVVDQLQAMVPALMLEFEKRATWTLEPGYDGTWSHGSFKPCDILTSITQRLSGCRPEALARWMAAFSPDDWPMDWTSPTTPRFDEKAIEQVQPWIVQEALDSLFELMNSLAPDGFSFGAHEGNGSDIGFWPVEEPTNKTGDPRPGGEEGLIF